MQQREQSSDPSSDTPPLSAVGPSSQRILPFSGQPSVTNSYYTPQEHSPTDFGTLSRVNSLNSEGNMAFPERRLDIGLGAMSAMTDPLLDQSFSYISEILPTSSDGATTTSPAGLDMVWPNWAPNLPDPELLRHL